MSEGGDAARRSRRFQAGDDVLQRLAESRPDKAVPGVGQHHDKGPHGTAAAGAGIMDQAQAPEVHLRHLTRRRVLHAHRGPAAPAPVSFLDEAPQRLVRHRAAATQQQLANTGQLQPVAGEPLVELVGPRGKQVLAGRLRLTRAGLADDRQPAELIISGNGPVPGNAIGFRRSQVLAHRVPGQAGA